MFEEVHVSSIEELIQILNAFSNSHFFRGQADAAWNLESSLERVLGQTWCADNARKHEDYSIRTFKSKFHLYDRENAEPKTKLAWLSIMQHYGVPTRLLDFTESPYVALYFALEMYDSNKNNSFAVYGIDYTDVMTRSINHVQSKNPEFKETRQSIFEKQDDVFDSYIDVCNYNIAWITEPSQLNSRLDRQSGSFILSANSGNKIQDVLSSSTYHSSAFKKIIIPGSLYQPVYALLRKMNINGKSLYGDLSGLGREIRMTMQVYSHTTSISE